MFIYLAAGTGSWKPPCCLLVLNTVANMDIAIVSDKFHIFSQRLASIKIVQYIL